MSTKTAKKEINVKTETVGGVEVTTFNLEGEEKILRYRAEGVVNTDNPPLSKSERSHLLGGTEGGFGYRSDGFGINVVLISGVRRPFVGLATS